MADKVTYVCRVPDCRWTLTDNRTGALSGAALLNLAHKQGVATGLVADNMARDHDQKLAAQIADHLRSHPDLAKDPNVDTAAVYILYETRKQITDGGDR